jgi:hypothetical protein
LKPFTLKEFAMLANWISRRRNFRRPQQAAVRQAVFETIEGRQYCDGTFGTATALGSPIGLIVKTGSVDAGSNHKDFYKITTPQAGRLRVSLTKMTGDNANLFLYNGASSGNQIGASTNGGTSDELIDLSNVGAKTYYVEVRYAGSGAKSNYQLGVMTDYAGSDTATARQAGSISSTEKVFQDFVGNSDQTDVYKFTSSKDGVVKVWLEGLSSDIDLKLLDSGGNEIKYSINTGTIGEVIYQGSSAATYYAKVYQYSTNTTNYKLHLSNLAIPSDPVGDTLATAKDLGTIGSYTGSDWVLNKFDTDDYYKFQVNETGPVSFTISKQRTDLKVQFLDKNGVPLTTNVTQKNGSPLTVSTPNPIGGTYYLHVFQATTGANGSASPYTLAINAPKDTAGNTMATAKALTLAGGAAAANGFVGVVDQQDWYKVSVAQGQTLHASISQLTDDADIFVFNSSGTQLAASAKGGTLVDSVNVSNLGAGTYFIKVSTYSTHNPKYHLDVSVN